MTSNKTGTSYSIRRRRLAGKRLEQWKRRAKREGRNRAKAPSHEYYVHVVDHDAFYSRLRLIHT